MEKRGEGRRYFDAARASEPHRGVQPRDPASLPDVEHDAVGKEIFLKLLASQRALPGGGPRLRPLWSGRRDIYSRGKNACTVCQKRRLMLFVGASAERQSRAPEPGSGVAVGLTYEGGKVFFPRTDSPYA
ncbi:unnamed protein product [Gadus morhua 'NCC']